MTNAKTLDSEFIVRESNLIRSPTDPAYGRMFACLRKKNGKGTPHYLHRDGVVRVSAWQGAAPMGFFSTRTVMVIAYSRWIANGRPTECPELVQ